MVHQDHHLLVLDVETTGLDPERDFLLELAAIAVDDQLQVVSEFQSLVTEAATLEHIELQLHPKVRLMHEANGLLEELRQEYAQPQRQSTPDKVEAAFLQFLRKAGMQPGRIELVGYSPHFDKMMLRRAFPLFDWASSHQIMDVGGVRRFFNLSGFGLKKRLSGREHRACNDAYASLEELRDLTQIAARARVFFTAA